MTAPNHQIHSSSKFSSAAKAPPWQLIPLKNSRSPGRSTHQSLYKASSPRNMVTMKKKPVNSFPPGIFDQHWKNVAAAKKEIDEDLAKAAEQEKENQNEKRPSSPKASSLATAVSNGKEKITDFFNKRNLGRGGGGISDATSVLTDLPNNTTVNHSANVTTPVSNKSNSPKTPPRVNKVTGTVVSSTYATPTTNSTPMTSSNDNSTLQTTSIADNHNAVGHDKGTNGNTLHNHDIATPGSVNNDIFNSGLDNYNGSSIGTSNGNDAHTQDTDMAGNNIGVSANNSTPADSTNEVKVSNVPGKSDSNNLPSHSTSGNNKSTSTNHQISSGSIGIPSTSPGNTTTTNPSTANTVHATSATSDVGNQGPNAPGNNTTTPAEGAIAASVGNDSTTTQGSTTKTSDGPVNNNLLVPASFIPATTVNKVFASTYTTVVDFHIRHKGQVTDFNLEEMFDGMVIAFTAVDPTIWFKSWNSDNVNKIWSKDTIPTEETEMKDFVEDPHTAPIGPFGRFYGRLTIVSNVEFSSFRRDTTFSAFLRNTGLFIERGDLECTRTRQIGFFNKKLPHDTRIPFFTLALKQLIPFRKPFQIISQPLYEGTGSVLKCFVYVLIADPRHEKELLEDLAVLNHTDLEFHSWSAFKESKQRTTKVGIINDMNTFAIGHSSILIKGLDKNCLMRMFSTKLADDDDMTTPEEFVDACLMDDDLFTEDEVDLNYRLQQLSCVDFMYSHFVDTDDNPIYVQINGPINGLMEVIFKNENWDHARKIEKQFQAIMIPFMTPASIKHAFTNGSRLLQRPPDSIHWRPPILTTKVNPANTMNEVATKPLSKKLQHGNFSFTKNSQTSYKSAALAGTRKVDIPSTTKLTTYAGAVVGDITPTLHHGNVVSTMSEKEILSRFQSYDAVINSMKDTYDAEIIYLKQQVSEIASLKAQVTELQSLKHQVSTLTQQHLDTQTFVETHTSDLTSKYAATKKSVAKFKRTITDKIESSHAELRESIKRRSRKETANTNKTQTMLKLLLNDRQISFIEEDDDELDDSDDEEYMEDQLEDDDDQYDSADEDFFDDDADLEDYDENEPYVFPHDDPADESRKAASLGGLDKKNIIQKGSRTRSQRKSQSQGAAGSK